MRWLLRLIAVLSGVLWGGLLIENIARYLHGWGHALLIDLYGLIPVVGLTVAIAVLFLARETHTRFGIWVVSISAFFAVLYLAVEQVPFAIDAHMVHIQNSNSEIR